ncbi:hypothetical protein B0J14DRAFT_89432 [Halenospora varia]|nr:hypothetical protein B0J14DRAFT_89432 [Halenospora varia]
MISRGSLTEHVPSSHHVFSTPVPARFQYIESRGSGLGGNLYIDWSELRVFQVISTSCQRSSLSSPPLSRFPPFSWVVIALRLPNRPILTRVWRRIFEARHPEGKICLTICTSPSPQAVRQDRAAKIRNPSSSSPYATPPHTGLQPISRAAADLTQHSGWPSVSGLGLEVDGCQGIPESQKFSLPINPDWEPFCLFQPLDSTVTFDTALQPLTPFSLSTAVDTTSLLAFSITRKEILLQW